MGLQNREKYNTSNIYTVKISSIIANPRWGGWAINPKIVQKAHNNIILKSLREVSANFRGVSAYIYIYIFFFFFFGGGGGVRGVSEYFRGVSAYFHLETIFQIFERSFEKFKGNYGSRGFTMILIYCMPKSRELFWALLLTRSSLISEEALFLH